MILFTLVISFFGNILSISGLENFEDILLYGPGLTSNESAMPVHYVFIQPIDKSGNTINQSLGQIFEVKVTGHGKKSNLCRIWFQLHDLFDGRYLIRYRVYQTCSEVEIRVQHDSKDVHGTPIIIKGPIYPDECFCPKVKSDDWEKMVKCPTSYKQIVDDLLPFQNVDFNVVLQETIRKFGINNTKSFCNYVIKSNKVYRKCYGKHVDFKIFTDRILISLTSKMILPDFEFIMNLGDWPLIGQNDSPKLPIFSWCGSHSTFDIVMPTYDITESTLEMMGRVSVDMFSVQSSNKVLWKDKISKGFWRGRDSTRERLDLVLLSRANPDLINASLTNFFFFKEEEEKYGPKTNHISFFDFFNYKYQINLDGTVAAYRLPYLLAGSGVVLKQDSYYYEHFYHGLKPYVHYIPFKRDLSDLVEKIKWAIDNDEKAYEIGRNGHKFAQENLLPLNIICYHISLFKNWSRRLQNEVTIREGMERIVPASTERRFGQCYCDSVGNHDEL